MNYLSKNFNIDVFNIFKAQKASSKFLANILMVNIGVLLLFCLPLNQFEMKLSGLHQPSITLSYFLIIVTILLGSWEVAYRQQFKYSAFSNQLLLCLLLALIPCFYFYSKTEQAWNYAINLVIFYLFFVSLRQFNFNLTQRYLLLAFPILASWFFFIALASSVIIWRGNASIINNLVTDIEAILGVLVLTSLSLSLYLLVRTQKKFGIITILLLLTPLVSVSIFLLLPNSIYLYFSFFIVLTSQPFLFRYGSRFRHCLWLVSYAIGINLLYFSQDSLLYIELFSEQQWLNIKDTINLFFTHSVSGVGIGQLKNELLLAKIKQGFEFNQAAISPSWLLTRITEGGIFVILVAVSFAFILIKKLFEIKKGARTVFFNILFPSLYAMIFTSYSSLNPLFPLLLLTLLFWIDDLTVRPQKIHIKECTGLLIINRLALVFTLLLVSSSIFLNFQAEKTNKLTNKQLDQYQYHPWWNEYFYNQKIKRELIANFHQQNDLSINQNFHAKKMALSQHPSPKGYQELIDMAKMFGKIELAEQSFREAKRLFPSHHFSLE